MRVETTRVGRRRATELTRRTAILVAFVVILLVSLLSLGIASLAARGSSVTSSIVSSQSGAIPWNGRDTLNVLVLGLNSRSPRPARTSAMMILSYDPSTRSERLLAIPTSLWVTIPGFGQDTIANAYAEGGPRLALLVTQSAMHVVIPYYLALGTDAFRQLIDTYSGVSVKDPAFVTLRNPTGTRHMTGSAALAYIQAGGREPESDVQRMPRFQRVFLAWQHQAFQPQSLFQVAATVNAVGGSVATNFSYSQVPALANALGGIPRTHIHTGSLDYLSGAVSDYSTKSADVLLPDWQRIHAVSRNFFPDQRLGYRAVEVLNGAGMVGAAESLARWLRQMGVGVARYGSAHSFDYARTQVIVNAPSRQNTDLARAVAAMLQAPVVTGVVRYSKSPVVVIIGADFEDPAQQ